jgi:hypothetical protein
MQGGFDNYIKHAIFKDRIAIIHCKQRGKIRLEQSY